MRHSATKEGILSKLFGSASRASILNVLFCHSERTFYQREIMFETGLSLRPVQRELANLVELGIIKKQEANNRVYYQINTASPFFKPLSEICGLAQEEVGQGVRSFTE